MIEYVRIERELEETTESWAFIGRFIACLGDPSEYEWDGNDPAEGDPSRDHCICGHPIKWLYGISHKKDQSKTAIVGSECINHFKDCNPALYEELSKARIAFEEKLATIKKTAIELQRQKEIEKLRTEYETLYHQAEEEFNYYRNQGRKAPYLLWATLCHTYMGLPEKPPIYKRSCDYIRFYKKYTEELLRRKNKNWIMG